MGRHCVDRIYACQTTVGNDNNNDASASKWFTALDSDVCSAQLASYEHLL